MEGNQPAQQPATGGPEGSSETQQTELTPAQKEAIRKFKVKIDGREAEVDENELVRGYTHAQAAHARMREAAELRKKVEPILQKFSKAKQDPSALLDLGQDLGVDLKSLARQMTLEEMRLELMDEDERKQYERDKKLSYYERLEQQQREQQAKERLEHARTQIATQLETELLEFYEKEVGDVPSPHLVGRMLEYIIAAHTNGQNLPYAKAYQLAKKDFEKLEGETFNQKLQKMIASGQIPQELVAMVRKADLEKMRQQPVRRTAQTQEKKPSKPLNIDDWFNKMEGKQK